MDDEQRISLVGGPYRHPNVKPGGRIMDEIDGLVVVGGYTSAPIPWLRRRKTGRASLILCDDLVTAVRRESALAICHHFGVSNGTVSKWRNALGVDRQNNAGTQRLYRELIGVKLPDEKAARGREAASLPEAKSRAAVVRKGVPAHPNTRAALLAAAKAPKPKGWGKRANQWMQEAKDKH